MAFIYNFSGAADERVHGANDTIYMAPDMQSGTGRGRAARAVVLGASIAGLLAARFAPRTLRRVLFPRPSPPADQDSRPPLLVDAPSAPLPSAPGAPARSKNSPASSPARVANSSS
jgi:hypothetical protein